MGTNEDWPEAFGFSLSGGSPVVISEVEEGGSAQQAGLQPGDALIELDGVCVEEWSRIEVWYETSTYPMVISCICYQPYSYLHLQIHNPCHMR